MISHTTLTTRRSLRNFDFNLSQGVVGPPAGRSAYRRGNPYYGFVAFVSHDNTADPVDSISNLPAYPVSPSNPVTARSRAEFSHSYDFLRQRVAHEPHGLYV